MSDTFSQISIQVIFCPKYREALILPSFQEELYKYISGIFKKKKNKILAINGMEDHIHLFFEMSPDISLSELIKIVKVESSNFINEKGFLPKKFQWQDGYGGFSYSHSQRASVIKYIMEQQKHHAKTTFRLEYCNFLKKFDIEAKEQYLFEFFE